MKLGIIGGSGLYELPGLIKRGDVQVETPFGAPSDPYLHGDLNGREVFFLPRHGRGHRLLPSEINHRANIFGFKKLGVERIISVSAVGSLREELRPRDVVLPDQYIDRTKNTVQHTFFGRGIVAHVTFADPICAELRARMHEAVGKTMTGKSEYAAMKAHNGGTYVNMEGPLFSTKAESNLYRQWGGDIIGMTSLAEAKLCREAEICYALMAMVTDYDCWNEAETTVTVDMVIANLTANVHMAREIVGAVVADMPELRTCFCGHALQNAIMTDPKVISDSIYQELKPLVGKYIKR